MKENRFWIGLSLVALGLLGALGGFVLRRDTPVAASAAISGPVVVIDAGHGGEDGGAVAPDGTEEADVNLEVARRLDVLLRLMGRTPCCCATATFPSTMTAQPPSGRRRSATSTTVWTR